MVDLLTRSWWFQMMTRWCRKIFDLFLAFAETVQIWHADPARDYAFCSVKR
jgi:hypothetical protein